MKAWLLAASLVSIWPVAQTQVVQWDIQSRYVNPYLTRRSESTIQETIANKKSKGGYFATVQIGTPAQNLTLQLDTGSSDLWVPWSGSTVCENSGCQQGSYNPKNSSSFDDIGANQFSITYVDNSYAQGDYFTDDVTMSGTTINNLTMGLAVKTTISYGLMGIGYAINEASVDTMDSTYPNLPVALYQGGQINTVAYSLWLNDLSASSGTLLFGGIDTKKYTGSLSRINVQSDNGTYNHFDVMMTSLKATSSSGTDKLSSSDFPLKVVLDSGTTLTYLPDDLATQVWKEVGAEWSSYWQMAVLPCSYGQHGGNFTFGFGGQGGPEIAVGMDELVLDLSQGSQPRFTSGTYKGETLCQFGIQNYSTTDSFILGASFLRSAYVVYDLVNNQIALAQTNFNATESSIVAFKSKGATIPSATAAPNQNQTQSTPTSTTTSTNLTAAEGFQKEADSAASFLAVTGSSFMLVGMSMAFMLVGSGAFSSNLY